MALRQDIKPKFETNDIPSQADFYEVFDSFVHKDEDKATTAMVDAGIDDEHYVTPALLRLGLQNMGVITGGGNLPYKQNVDNFNGTFINLEWLPIESSVKVFKNGQLLLEGETAETGDYTIDYEMGAVIFSAPVANRNIEIDYWYRSSDPIPGNGTNYVDLTTNQSISGNKAFADVTDFTEVVIDNGGSNRALHVINNGDVQGVFIRSTDSGDSLVINDSATATGTPLKIQKDDVTKFSVDGNGQAIASSFVKYGATSDDVLLGDGSTTSLSALGSGNIDYVSATVSGIVDNTSLQELGGVDKLINSIRIGKGNGTGEENTVFGFEALDNNTSSYNTAIGSRALNFNTSGTQNTAAGAYSSYLNTTGKYNTSIGLSAGYNNTTASYNTAIGAFSLFSNQFGEQNIAIGNSALQNNIGVNGSNVYGHRSIAIGVSAMLNNTTGNGIAIGNAALRNQTTGMWNICIGTQAGSGITTGTGNVVVADTGFIAAGGGITTGSNNLIVAPSNGNTTGITTGSGNIVIGKVTGLAAAASNTITLADGVGNIALSKATTGELTAPNLTTSLITSGGNKSLVTKEYLGTYASLSSPAFTGTPTAPTATAGTNTTQVATTAYVQNAVSSAGSTYGIYTPTYTTGTNTTAISNIVTFYTVVGKVVTVQFICDVTQTVANNPSVFRISLPSGYTTLASSTVVCHGTVLTPTGPTLASLMGINPSAGSVEIRFTVANNTTVIASGTISYTIP